MADELKEKIAKLPAWAREHIRKLGIRAEPNTDELARLRREVEKLNRIRREQQDRIDAMVEMFQCAAKGGSEIAAAVAGIVDTWIVDDAE